MKWWRWLVPRSRAEVDADLEDAKMQVREAVEDQRTIRSVDASSNIRIALLMRDEGLNEPQARAALQELEIEPVEANGG